VTLRRFRNLCVFCGSSPGRDPVYTRAAREVGRLLAHRGIGVVYGGGRVGMMGAVAEAALAAGGTVLGIIPEALMRSEIAYQGLTELRVVHSMHERKQMMADASDGFLALPGGFGTFEEFCEILTWAQLGIHAKPCGLLNVAGYYDPLMAMFDRAVAEGFLRERHRALMVADSDPERLLTAMARFEAGVAEPLLSPDIL
jgi:uncharacterized protein (TIGR00730 family)